MTELSGVLGAIDRSPDLGVSNNLAVPEPVVGLCDVIDGSSLL